MKILLNSEKEKYIETVDHFTLTPIKAITKGRSKDPVYYLKQPAFLDTETSHNHNEDDPIGWIYQWCLEFNGQYLIGRKPRELVAHIKQLSDYYELNDKKRLVIYIHNASYDMTYLYKFMNEVFGVPELLAIKPHKILTARYGGIEFRCSWLLSNMSLRKWGEKLGCKVLKLSGAIDYDVIRYQDSELDIDTDWRYMINDVAALKCCVYEEMKAGHDTIVSIPLTSTGYVRRDCRHAARKEQGFREWFKKTRLDVPTYTALFWSYAGGLTHGNRHLAGVTIPDVRHVDYKSFYPSNDMMRYLPMGEWSYIYDYLEMGAPLDDRLFQKYLNTYCCIIMIRFDDLRLKDGVTCPVISKNKIYNFHDCQFTINEAGTVGTDNGRVINCIGKPIIYCTELDLYWIFSQYDTNGYQVLKLFISQRGYDREAIRTVTNEYFKIKETLEKDSYFYFKSKNKLNSVYGMKSTNNVRSEVKMDPETGEWTELRDMSDDHIAEALDKYYKSYNSFNAFQHGVYITSWARFLLLSAIRDVVGYQNYIYCDTDSIFYKNDRKIRKRLYKFNQDIIELNKKLGLGVTNRNGDISYYGVLESEMPCKRFRFLHAKCYAFIDNRNRLQCIIAGVTSDNGKEKDDPEYVTREQELKDINRLTDGMIFKECGGTMSKYIDRPACEMLIDGHLTQVGAACIIKNIDKEIGGTVDGFNIYEVIER